MFAAKLSLLVGLVTITEPSDVPPSDTTSSSTPEDSEDSRSHIPDVLRPSTRPNEISGGLGTKIGLPGGGSIASFPIEFFHHFQNRADGPAIGASLEPSLASGIIALNLGPSFRWDFQPMKDLGLYVGPQITAGYGLFTFTYAGLDRIVSHVGFLRIAANARLSLADRSFVFIRPAQITVTATSSGASATFDILVGGGIAF
ncbi:MAG: hypothetical protein AAGF11_52400 [Myxococcota bacterium]